MRFFVSLVLLFLLGVAASPAECAGDGTPSALEIVVEQNLETSYFYPFGGVGNGEPLMFEGKVCPHYAISWRQRQSALVFAFKSIVRMYDEPSVPVRTPSYMPRLIYYNYGERQETHHHFYYIMLSHHSNGQEGSFFDYDGSVNLVDGGFSTNFLELGLFRYTFSDIAKPEGGGRPWWTKFSGGAAFQVHLPINRSEELEEIHYGFYRLKYWNRIDLGKKLELSLSSFLILGPLHEAETWDWRRLGLDLSLSRNWELFEGFDLVLNIYVGQDYYNIWYTHHLRTIRLGLVTDIGDQDYSGPDQQP